MQISCKTKGMHVPSSAASLGYLPLGMILVFFMTPNRYGGSSKTVQVRDKGSVPAIEKFITLTKTYWALEVQSV